MDKRSLRLRPRGTRHRHWRRANNGPGIRRLGSKSVSPLLSCLVTIILTTNHTVLILNTSKYAPKFTMGWSILTGFSACQLAMVFVIRWLVQRDKRRAREQQQEGEFSGHHDRGNDVEGGVSAHGNVEDTSAEDSENVVPTASEMTKV